MDREEAGGCEYCGEVGRFHGEGRGGVVVRRPLPLLFSRDVLREMGGGDRDGGDGGGFGAEDARAEGDGLPLMLGEECHLFRGPAAFGADGYGYFLTCSFGGCRSK